jgi:putative tryptophan/tyrosine transport system ATP-binding protein
LLLDEPTAALDPRSADTVMRTADKLIHDFELTSILITHNLKDAYQYGSRIIQMNEGAILRDISGDEKNLLSQNDIFNWFS